MCGRWALTRKALQDHSALLRRFGSLLLLETNIHQFHVNNRSTSKRCEICLKLTINIRQRRHSPFSSVSIVDFEQANVCCFQHFKIIFLLINFFLKHFFLYISIYIYIYILLYPVDLSIFLNLCLLLLCLIKIVSPPLWKLCFRVFDY